MVCYSLVRRVDYDKTNMPAGYDRGRKYSPQQLARWLDIVADSVGNAPVTTIMDLGCGTGRYSAGLSSRLNARVVGVEPSEKMILEARKKATSGVRLLRACGESLPLRDNSIDMVFMSMVFHHFSDANGAIQECRRVLRHDRFACLRAGTIEQIDKYAFVPFFPESRPLLERSLNRRPVIESTFASAGFELYRYNLIQSEAAKDWPEYVERLSLRADSILAQLSDSEFQMGLGALREYATTAPPGAVVEPVDFFVFRAI
jgi:ubiquinone/menaquinone biosynthesis C-methylase UbiE